jgi:hypothetical protein
MKLTEEVLEKIEMLQNIMMQAVTSNSGDHKGYVDLRAELLDIPGLKEALPRFVRTCNDLSQFWHSVKAQGLSSYDSRRTYIREGFSPLLAGIHESAVGREVFFEKGSAHDAYVHIRGILQNARADLFLIDPYMDGSIYQLLGSLSPARLSVKILTSKAPADFKLEATKFVKQHNPFALDIRAARDFHDRFVILDNAKVYLLGASIKDAGNKGFTIVPLEDVATTQFLLDHANQVWTTATPL